MFQHIAPRPTEIGRGEPKALTEMIDFNLLCNILSPGIFVILAGGLLTGYDTATLIVIGVIGYSIVFLMRRLAKKQDNK